MIAVIQLSICLFELSNVGLEANSHSKLFKNSLLVSKADYNCKELTIRGCKSDYVFIYLNLLK